MFFASKLRIATILLSAAGLSACAGTISPPHLKPLPAELRATLAKKGMTDDAPMFIRVFKKESQLEVWKLTKTGTYGLLKSYPVCKWSGGLGPKLRQGDKQAPEGFYNVAQGNMNPHSKFHLSFNLGYPNRYDRAHGRTGAHLMVHGKCKSAGCYAMTDALMEEIYLLARDAFIGGQETIPVHAFPFRMTTANMIRYRKHKWYPFWRTLKEGYDHFEAYRTVPKVDVCASRYLINASFIDANAVVDAKSRCPRYRKFLPGANPSPPRELIAKSSPSVPTYVNAGSATAAVSLTPPRLPRSRPSQPTLSARPVVSAPDAVTSPATPRVQSAGVPQPMDTPSAVMFGDLSGAGSSVLPRDQFEQLISDALRDPPAQ